jgi:hypothetical protein
VARVVKDLAPDVLTIQEGPSDIREMALFVENFIFKHAFIDRVPEDERFTAIFDDFVDDISDRPILLDHILVSPALSSF